MITIKHSLLLVAFAAFVPNWTKASSPAVTVNLIEWILSKDGGIYNTKQEEITDEETGTRGMFASEDIEQGEIILQVPWDSIIGAEVATKEVMEAEFIVRKKLEMMGEEDFFMDTKCRAVQALYDEAEKGETSDFAPHLKYLSLLGDDGVVPAIPAAWSQDGRDLLEDINDHGSLPPKGLFTTLNHDWYGACIEDIKNSPLEAKVAAVVASHGGSGNVLREYGIIVPLVDNYYYKSSHGSVNVKLHVEHGEYLLVRATRDIPKGNEILRPYGDFFDEMMAPNVFREFGIVDTTNYPKMFEFEVFFPEDEEGGFTFGLEVFVDDDDDEDDGLNIHVHAYDEDIHNDDLVEMFFTREVNRLNRLKALAEKAGFPEGGGMTRREWDTAWIYHSNLVNAMELTLESFAEGYDGEICPGGQEPSSKGRCPIWDGFDALPSETIPSLDLEFDEENPYGPTEDAYGMCNDEDITSWDSYVPAGDVEFLKSQYQEIRFFTDPETKDMVMKLDGTVQQVSTYRPHYHEFAVHFPARFLESVKRVLFVGGGDSMVLHEALKYPSLEKVVGLELDQYVLRNSFRYFNSQPHFDDKRVEWWFGDGAKSLLMLPKDYFQSFDLVVVDLSETVMSFQVTNKLSIFQTLSLLLKPDGILLKNGEYYMEKMSTYFDYTLQYFEYDVPFICDQGMVIGSNKIDFFNRTIKDHGVELLVLESQEEILEKFNKYYRFTEYRKNDANAQKQCEDLVDDEERNNAGILMVLEAEKVTHDLQSSEAVEKTINDALKDVGFSIVSTVTHESSNFVIVTKEGYVAVRLYPENSYVGLDIQLWANFDLMQPASDALVESLGGTEEGTSSFRIVTGGMSGSPFQEVDKTKIGPRMVNTRNCEAHSSPSSEDKIVDLMGSSLEGSLAMIEDGVVAAVVCGSKDKPCKRLDILNKAPQSKLTKVIPVYTCKSMQTQGAEFSKDVAHKMAACEVELSDTLGSAGDKVSLLVIDDSAERFMGKVLLSLFGSVWNRKRLFTQNRFVAFVDSSSGGWRRNLLALIRNKIVYKPMSFVDVVVENSKDESTFSILSLQDPAFFLHLREMVDTYNEAHGEAANMEVKKVFDGLPPPQIGKFNPKIFLADDYDPTPAQEQLKGQTALGRQSLVQFEIQPAKIVNTVKVEAATIEAALDLAIDYDELEFTFFQDIANIGDGLVAVAYTSDGKTSAILKWDGKTHIDVNLFSADESPLLRKKFIDVFVETLNSKIPVQLALSDTHPRGVGRVISFPGHMN